MEYLPFGETLADEHLNSHNSPFKYNGKELDEETGNYYYSACYYDPKFSIFISVDPLVLQTGDAYGYCYQNPINLTDPTGMSASPIYDYDGNYLGNDNMGFQGEVIFMDAGLFYTLGGGDTNLDGSAHKSSIDHNLALALGLTLDEIQNGGMTNSEINMVNNAITHIVSNTESVSFKSSSLYNGKTSSYYSWSEWKKKDKFGSEQIHYYAAKANNPTPPNLESINYPAWANKKTNKITYNLRSDVWSFKGQFTVANIQNTYVHEGDAHIFDGVPGRGSIHSMAYYLQIQHPTWMNTTPEYKKLILRGLEMVLKE